VETAPPAFRPRVEHTTAAFRWAIGGGEPAPSWVDGEAIGKEIMAAWKRRGYIADADFVEAFSDEADYDLTLTGSHRAETSFWMQAANFPTIGLVPYSITDHYDVGYTLADRRTGRMLGAIAQASDESWVQLFLLAALPFSHLGHRHTIDRLADHLYADFVRQGGFQSPVAAPAHAPAY
jgi:hypothetical protein